MSRNRGNALLRSIPPINTLLELPQVAAWSEKHSRQLAVGIVNKVLSRIRENIVAGQLSFQNKIELQEHILKEFKNTTEDMFRRAIVPAVNATGIIIHTNLGRAPLSSRSARAVKDILETYTLLELDRSSGKRSSRYTRIEKLLTGVTGAPAALVVNNNAAAVLLALNTLAFGREVIVSRGELVEIGGSFRLPEVVKTSGVTMVEVGTTNRTNIADYTGAITENTAAILSVHQSNFRITGYTEQVELSELAKVANKNKIVLIRDLGSGSLIDLREIGIEGEPTVRDSLDAGADLVTLSGDKLLGGPQCGIILGKESYINRLKKNHLLRALRVDKITLAALEATLLEYYDPASAKKNIPVLRMMRKSPAALKKQAERLARDLKDKLRAKAKIKVVPGYSEIGGGSCPGVELKTFLVSLDYGKSAAEFIRKKLLEHDPPVIVRVNKEKILIDPRTLLQGDEKVIVEALGQIY